MEYSQLQKKRNEEAEAKFLEWVEDLRILYPAAYRKLKSENALLLSRRGISKRLRKKVVVALESELELPPIDKETTQAFDKANYLVDNIEDIFYDPMDPNGITDEDS